MKETLRQAQGDKRRQPILLPHERVRLRHNAWTLPSDRGTKILLHEGWQGDVISVNGREVTLLLSNWENTVLVDVADIECVNAPSKHHHD